MPEPRPDYFVLLSVGFDDTVDAISREMFRERMAEYRWEPVPGVPDTWKALFDGRSQPAEMIEGNLRLACQYARFERSRLKAVFHSGEAEPKML